MFKCKCYTESLSRLINEFHLATIIKWLRPLLGLRAQNGQKNNKNCNRYEFRRHYNDCLNSLSHNLSSDKKVIDGKWKSKVPLIRLSISFLNSSPTPKPTLYPCEWWIAYQTLNLYSFTFIYQQTPLPLTNLAAESGTYSFWPPSTTLSPPSLLFFLERLRMDDFSDLLNNDKEEWGMKLLWMQIKN